MNQKSFSELIESPESLNPESLPQLKAVVEEYPWFQTGWFLYLKNLKNCNSPEFNSELKKAAIHITDRKKLHDFLNPKHIIFPEIETDHFSSIAVINDNQVNQNTTNSLIDNFLISSQTIKKRKIQHVEEESNVDQIQRIQQSVSENDEIITETLASIYVKQKKYDKAIEAFNKLCIKYPEKSIYFAARIKDVELLMNF